MSSYIYRAMEILATLLTLIRKRIRRTLRRILLTDPAEDAQYDKETSDDDNYDDDVENVRRLGGGGALAPSDPSVSTYILTLSPQAEEAEAVTD
ncbi:hypothetical protein Tco_0695471 [Tanacetum coccineum]